MIVQIAKCDVCGRTGHIDPGWVVLRDFAYIKHACPGCARLASFGDGSHLRDARLSDNIRATLRAKAP